MTCSFDASSQDGKVWREYAQQKTGSPLTAGFRSHIRPDETGLLLHDIIEKHDAHTDVGVEMNGRSLGS
jgi:hypothetical protein